MWAEPSGEDSTDAKTGLRLNRSKSSMAFHLSADRSPFPRGSTKWEKQFPKSFYDGALSMIGRILYSNWFASLVLALATISLILLYLQGRTSAALAGAGLLVLAIILIAWGNRQKKSEAPRRSKRGGPDQPAGRRSDPRAGKRGSPPQGRRS